MAFPQIIDADTQFGTVPVASTSWTVTYPTHLNSGDLILMVAATFGATTLSSGGLIIFTSSSSRAHVGTRLSNGTETGTLTVNPAASNAGSWRIFRITNWGGGTASLTTASNVMASSIVNGTSTSPDSGNAAPLWATGDTLWLSMCGAAVSPAVTVWPLPDRNTSDVSGGATGATLGVCTQELNAVSLDPTAFTIDASQAWGAYTAAVRPGGVVVVPAEFPPRHFGPF